MQQTSLGFNEPPHTITMTKTEAAEAQKRFDAMVADYEAKRTTSEPNPMDYWVYQGFWAAAHHGSPTVCVVEDPPTGSV